MSDRLLTFAWNCVVLGLIIVLGAAALALVYMALLQLVSKRLDQGIAPLAAGLSLAAAVYLLARHRDELVGRDLA
ncbi:MAG TPA: hypothetical protein PLD59_00055 [Tepidisphaeraceae bacterium]|nr:hypothetical protein [Tepidisphaeraceae bacterium]